MMNNKIFIACDTPSISKVKEIIRKTQITSKLEIGYKFGLEFLNSKDGRNFISKIKNQTVFIDAKLHDIPNTCVSAVNALKDLNIDYLTMHISSGLDALKATKKVAGKIKLIGVTILTSLDNKSLKEIGFNKDIKNLVLQQAKLAQKAKLDAIVCSAQEVKIVKKVFKKEIITPGIRFASNTDDQKRVMTPKEAFKAGATSLVIGRPITKGNIKKNISYLINHLEK
jgi:orotidine-5'-phosphate decarboxylase